VEGKKAHDNPSPSHRRSTSSHRLSARFTFTLRLASFRRREISRLPHLAAGASSAGHRLLCAGPPRCHPQNCCLRRQGGGAPVWRRRRPVRPWIEAEKRNQEAKPPVARLSLLRPEFASAMHPVSVSFQPFTAIPANKPIPT
jgi:hypothetical protein